jgi:hypothetical protein
MDLLYLGNFIMEEKKQLMGRKKTVNENYSSGKKKTFFVKDLLYSLKFKGTVSPV